MALSIKTTASPLQFAQSTTPSELSFKQELFEGANLFDVMLSKKQITQLLNYIALLVKWNATYNLTAIRDPAQMVSHHLLDCLAVVKAFEGATNILDVGAGAGLPGIVLAIWALEAQPQMRITLVDTVHKKTAFLNQVKAELQLNNVAVHTARVEQLQCEPLFDIITSRAFAELKDFVAWSAHLLAKDGCFLAMKGVTPNDEIACVPSPWVVKEVKQLNIFALNAQRHLIRIAK